MALQKASLVLSRWMRQASSTGLPQAFTCPTTLDSPGRLGARSLHSSNRFRLAGSTGLFETLSLESLTRFGTLSLESLTPPTPDLDLLGVTSTDCATDLPT